MTKRVTLAIGLLCMALGLQTACDDDKKSGDGDGDGSPNDGGGGIDGDPMDGEPGDGQPGDGDGGTGDGDGGDGEPEGPTGTVTGFVYDTSSPPAALAGVRIVAPNGAVATTDAQGAFSLAGVNVGANVLLATDDDHSTGVRNVAVEEDAAGYVDFYLTGVTKVAFDPAKGGTIKTANGATATFQPDSLVRKDGGDAPVGDVTVIVTAPDPVKGPAKKALPGSSGATKDGKSGAIETYSSMEVRVVDSEGKELQVKKDKKARLDFPVSGDVTLTPPELDVWTFNELTGIWNLEGSSKKVRDDAGRIIYTTEIPHMSWWGSNAFIDQLTCMRGCVKDAAGAAVRGASVTLSGVDVRYFETQSVGADGCFAFDVKLQSKVSLLAASADGISAGVGFTSDGVEKQVKDGVEACQNLGDLTLTAREPGGCPPGYTDCNGVCIDLANDEDHCGPTCGTAVSCVNTPPYGGTCMEGKCACAPGQENCNGSCTNTQNDIYYCGSCTPQRSCDPYEAQEVCDNGVCAPIDCGDLEVCHTQRSAVSCADTTSSNYHCGGCNNPCGRSINDGQDLVTEGYVCTDGTCDCEPGIDKCVPSSESPNYIFCVDFDTDPENCGGCYQNNDVTDETRYCDYNNEVCTSGACVELECPGNGGLACYRQCVDQLTDETNCGGCGNYCNTGTQCVSGECVQIVCEGETTLCGNDCADLNTSSSHCGRCYHSCNGLACGEGQCVCDQDEQVCCPDSNQPYCLPVGEQCGTCPITT